MLRVEPEASVLVVHDPAREMAPLQEAAVATGTEGGEGGLGLKDAGLGKG